MGDYNPVLGSIVPFSYAENVTNVRMKFIYDLLLRLLKQFIELIYKNVQNFKLMLLFRRTFISLFH